jgi:DNA-binding transcriptional ArsR family regulator
MDGKAKKLYEMKAKVLAAMAHPVRLAIVEFLRDGEQCVCDIAEHVGSERSNVSRHLAVMLQAGILEHRKDGLRMLYRLKTPCVVGFLACVTDVLREQIEANNAVLKRL